MSVKSAVLPTYASVDYSWTSGCLLLYACSLLRCKGLFEVVWLEGC